jgi:hypothetical protein
VTPLLPQPLIQGLNARKPRKKNMPHIEVEISNRILTRQLHNKITGRLRPSTNKGFRFTDVDIRDVRVFRGDDRHARFDPTLTQIETDLQQAIAPEIQIERTFVIPGDESQSLKVEQKSHLRAFLPRTAKPEVSPNVPLGAEDSRNDPRILEVVVTFRRRLRSISEFTSGGEPRHKLSFCDRRC